MEATSLLLVRKERQTKVVLKPKERVGQRPIIIREENHSRAESHRHYLPKEKQDAPFCTLRRNFQSPFLSLLTLLTRQWLHCKQYAKIKIIFLYIKLFYSFFSCYILCNFFISIYYIYLSKYVM